MPRVSVVPDAEQRVLQTAIEDLYAVFADYPLREVIKGCAGCLSQIDLDRLHTVPLRLLTWDDLEGFLENNAAHTVGDAQDLRHFLPRLCELLAPPEQNSYCDLGSVELGSALSYFGYANWPQAEQQALQTFSLAWLQALLATMPHKYDDRVETLLCAVSQFTDDLTPYLKAWLNTPTWTSLAQLLAFIEYYQLDANAEKRRCSSWDSTWDQWDQVTAWLHQPTTRRWIRETWRLTAPSNHIAP